jgi:hypothetical protein
MRCDEVDAIRSACRVDRAGDIVISGRNWVDISEVVLNDDRARLRHRVSGVLRIALLGPGESTIDDEADHRQDHDHSNGNDDQRLTAGVMPVSVRCHS